MKLHVIFYLANVCLTNQFCSCEDNDVQQAFKSQQIVIDVIDKSPTKKAIVKYTKSNKEVDLGNEIAPVDVKEAPYVNYEADHNAYYTLTMIDPDAPNRKHPTLKEFQHWMVVNIPGSNVSSGDTLSAYIRSGPPRNSGFHRYIFLIYKQPRKLIFNEPHLNKFQALPRMKFSIKRFAEKYKLGEPVAGNFYQAQYDFSVPALHKELGLKF